MFDSRSAEGMVLNWRGPVLAAGIFVAMFAVLLLMARQNQSNTSEMGSSLREDPYGTSLLFNSYARGGYQVKRGQFEDSLSDENALNTTAFFIGGHSSDWRKESDNLLGGKFGRRLENFLASGGRVVLVAPSRKLKSASQGWEVENKWNQTPHESGSTWISPEAGTMPAGIEKMYLTGDAPWLETDTGWVPLFKWPADADAKDVATRRVYMAMRQVGKGELIVASQESFLLNEAIKTDPSPALLDFLVGGRPVIWVDETLHGLRQDEGVLWLVQRYRLQAALLLFWATLLALLWSLSGDLVQSPAPDPGAQVMRYSEGAEQAARRLLQRSIPAEQVVAECWEEFRRRSPQDAQAISADPQTGPRLRAALTQHPLLGYGQLSRLIAERRASAKGLALADRNAPGSSTSLAKKGSEEARFA